MAREIELDPMVAVHAFVEAFNDNDVARAEAACMDETVILDDFPPHEWSGNRAVTRWFNDMGRFATEYGMSDPSVALAEPLHVMVSDRYAYVVAPVDVRWLENGTPAERTGFMTLGVREGADGWRIAACVWTWS